MKRPNVVFILTDDQGAWALNCAGTPEIHTPNLDRIAQRGMRFDNFFCVSPVSSPARASLLTGDIPSSHGVHDWIRSGNLDREKFEDVGRQNPYFGGYDDEDKPIRYLGGKTTYTDVLAQNGYTCALSGKWHLGDSIQPQHGFKYWYTIGKGGCYYNYPDIVEDGNIIIENGYVTDLITDKALDFLDDLTVQDNPFYLSVHYTAPHSPWEAEHHPDEFIEMYKDCEFESIPNVPDHKDMATGPVYGTQKRRENLIGYFAAVTAMDYNVGRILDKLEKIGILDDTIIIFSSDNGMNMGHHGIWGKGNGTFPMNMYDTSVKVPFLISYPSLIPKGSVCSDMVSAYDFFPTLMDLLGIKTDAIKDLPGRSFYKSLLGESRDSDDSSIVVFDEYGPVRMIRSRHFKYIHRYPYGPNEFYDLVKDPDENNNCIDDPNYRTEILEMRKKLEKWFAEYADPEIDGTREGVTGLGQLCRAGVHSEKLVKYAQR